MKQNEKFNKLYASLIPFLKETKLYTQLQKVFSESKELTEKYKFQLAIYLICKEFGAGGYVERFGDFEKREENIDKKGE